jgi:hypothetical protein
MVQAVAVARFRRAGASRRWAMRPRWTPMWWGGELRGGSGGGGVPMSGQRNTRCWRQSGHRGALGHGDARGRVVGAMERPVEDGTGGCPP